MAPAIGLDNKQHYRSENRVNCQQLHGAKFPKIKYSCQMRKNTGGYQDVRRHVPTIAHFFP